VKTTRLLTGLLLVALTMLLVAACGGDDEDTTESAAAPATSAAAPETTAAAETTAAETTAEETTAAETTAAEETAEETTAEETTAAESTAVETIPTEGGVSAECMKGQAPTKKDGVLTIGTDKPAFPPYIIDDDPTNGKGFESAVAYAVAKAMGFEQADVKWTVVPFNSSYAPGEKKFDFDINQISINAKRQRAVDFSQPYYTTPQAVLTTADSPAASATSLADLKDVQLGVQIGTTSLEAANEAIQPSKDPRVFDTSNDVVAALKNGQVEAIVVDLPTALYLAAAELDNGKIVGQFSAPGGDQWGLLLQKDSPLTTCVDQALMSMVNSGELQAITDQWIGADAAPVLE
jgi:polar amino acid transport system substrate-binding protein